MPQSCDSCGIHHQQEREVFYEKTHHKEAFSHQSKLEIYRNSSFLLVTVSLNRQTREQCLVWKAWWLLFLAQTAWRLFSMIICGIILIVWSGLFSFSKNMWVSHVILMRTYFLQREKKKKRHSSWENKVVAFSFLLKFNEFVHFLWNTSSSN